MSAALTPEEVDILLSGIHDQAWDFEVEMGDEEMIERDLTGKARTFYFKAYALEFAAITGIPAGSDLWRRMREAANTAANVEDVVEVSLTTEEALMVRALIDRSFAPPTWPHAEPPPAGWPDPFEETEPDDDPPGGWPETPDAEVVGDPFGE